MLLGSIRGSSQGCECSPQKGAAPLARRACGGSSAWGLACRASRGLFLVLAFGDTLEKDVNSRILLLGPTKGDFKKCWLVRSSCLDTMQCITNYIPYTTCYIFYTTFLCLCAFLSPGIGALPRRSLSLVVLSCMVDTLGGPG